MNRLTVDIIGSYALSTKHRTGFVVTEKASVDLSEENPASGCFTDEN